MHTRKINEIIVERETCNTQGNEAGFRVTRCMVEFGVCYLDLFLQGRGAYSATLGSVGLHVLVPSGERCHRRSGQELRHLKLWLPPGDVRLPEIAVMVIRR